MIVNQTLHDGHLRGVDQTRSRVTSFLGHNLVGRRNVGCHAQSSRTRQANCRPAHRGSASTSCRFGNQLDQGHWQAERNVPDVRLSSKINLSPYASVPETNSFQRQTPQAEQDTFNWRAQWYPVAVVNDLDPSRPHATKLLGDDYVLMRDADKVWRCLEDKCSHRFFTHEYTMNNLIAKYPKPYISLLDGIVMGGGAGVSIHGSFRVATEKSMFAMPECGIGLFVDIGAAYFLSRLPGEMGMYLALTGQRLKGIELKESTLATHYLPSSRLPELEEAIQGLGSKAGEHSAVHHLISSFEGKDTPPQQSDLLLHLPEMNACFNQDSVEAIHASLKELDNEWSQSTLKLMNGGSPTSQKICFRHVKAAINMSLAKVLEEDYRLLHHMCHISNDFVEGIRAKLIEKDNNARWKPATVDEVTDDMVSAYFRRLKPSEELQLEETTQHLHSRL